jgi:valyl-tRNA synthetase
MEKTFEHKKIEKNISQLWETGGYFKAKIDPAKKPYTILLPPPNASGKMHTGNVLMIAIEDLLIRWKRMQGYSALWVPGTDHAGFETQTTFERELKKENKSRFDFDRKTLYNMIWDFVQNNKGQIEDQIKSMGASVDWSRYVFMLDDKVINVVLDTFATMVDDGLVYRNDYVVNYSFKWGTTFSDAEIVMREQKDPLYYIKYGPFILATVRPETKFGDTAVAVNPKDNRYKEWVGREIEVEGLTGNFKLKVIADSYVDPEFGTGVVKITPAHDKNDYEVGLRHNLEVKNIIGLDGRLTKECGKYAGLKVLEARKMVVEDLIARGLMEKVDENYTHMVPVDYRSEDYVEQLVLPNWFVKVEKIKQPALDAVLNKQVKIYPKWREKTYIRWMESMRDWPISRQIVWGIRIPAWYNVTENPDLEVTFVTSAGVREAGQIGNLLNKYTLEEIDTGLQTIIAPKHATYVVSKEKPGDLYLQETNTFDTWFSSGQWPLTTLGFPDSDDFKYFYPTNVMETGWEIITRWVSRMMMFGMYLTGPTPFKGEPPFKDIYLHGIVRALDGKKMSKSLGNVINPEEYQDTYGTDALRMGLISGTANGKDFAFPRDKVIGYRNFANKVWNMTRFMLMMMENEDYKKPEDLPSYSTLKPKDLSDEDKLLIKGLKALVKSVDRNLEKYRFADAAEAIYQFMWHEVADKYIESVKNRDNKKTGLIVLRHVMINSLKVLHPFMPFITEALWQEILGDTKRSDLAISTWPEM